MTAPVILIEASPRVPADGTVQTVRLAGAGAVRPFHYAGAHWREGIMALPTIVTAIDYPGDDLGKGGIPQALTISWSPATRAALDELAALYWADAVINVYLGPEGTALPPLRIGGRVLDTASDSGSLQIAMADPAAELKRPLLVDRFAGTGGAEGPAEWTGRIRRRGWGELFNVVGDPIDQANNIYCFGDPSRQWQAFTAVRDKGAAADAEDVLLLAWQGSVAATFAALQGAAAPAGGGVLCPSLACIKWWTRPAGDLCADARGEIAGGYVETAPQIVERMVSARSTIPFVMDTVDAAAGIRPAQYGWLADDESATVAELLDTILGDVSLVWVLDAGAISLRPWAWGASAASGHSEQVKRRKVHKPVGSRRLGWKRNWHKMARGDIAASLLIPGITYEDGTPFEDLKPAQPGATNGATPAQAAQLVTLTQAAALAFTRIDAADAAIAGVDADILDLFETYGHTASAATSAALAAARADDAADHATSAGGSASAAAGSAAIANGQAFAAANFSELAAAYGATRGLTPNGMFDVGTVGAAGAPGWSIAFGDFRYVAGPYGTAVYSVPGLSSEIISLDFIEIDTARRYILHAHCVLTVAPQITYAGLSCYDGSGGYLGNIYTSLSDGVPKADGSGYDLSDTFAGVLSPGGAPPWFGAGARAFYPGTVKVKPIFIANYGSAAGGNAYLQDLFLEDITESAKAATQAGISQSAAAGASADAATVETKVGLAAAYAGDANSSAIIAGNQAGIATSKASAAQVSSEVAASVVPGGVTRNPQFAVWTSADPAHWSRWWGGGVATKVAGLTSPNAWHFEMDADAQDGGYQYEFGTGPGWYVLEATVQLTGGTLRGAGLFVQGYSADFVTPIGSGLYLDFYQHADISGNVIGGGVVGNVYRFARLVHQTEAAVGGHLLYAMAAWNGFSGSSASKYLTFFEAKLRGASDQEIAAHKATADVAILSATVSTNISAIADVASQVAAVDTKVTTTGATVDSHTAALSTLNSNYGTISTTVSVQGITISDVQSALAATNGQVTTLFARAALRLDVNGYWVGWEINNNGSYGSMLVNIDYFAIGKAGVTTGYPFEVVGGAVYMKKAVIQDASINFARIENLAVGTLKIADHSVTNSVPLVTLSPVTLTDYTMVTICGGALGKQVASSGVEFKICIQFESNDDCRGTVFIQSASTHTVSQYDPEYGAWIDVMEPVVNLGWACNQTFATGGSNTRVSLCYIAYITGLPIGNDTYYLRFQRTGGASYAVAREGSSLTITEDMK